MPMPMPMPIPIHYYIPDADPDDLSFLVLYNIVWQTMNTH